MNPKDPADGSSVKDLGPLGRKLAETLKKIAAQVERESETVAGEGQFCGISVLSKAATENFRYAIIRYPRIPWERLSAKEREVVLYVAGGICNKEIAQRQHTAPSTTASFFNRIFLKLSIRSRFLVALHAFLDGEILRQPSRRRGKNGISAESGGKKRSARRTLGSV